MAEVSLGLIFQIIAIIGGLFTVIMGIYWFFAYLSFVNVIRNLFLIILGLMIIIPEIYIFDFFKYFGFLLTVWGKAIFYFYLGFFVFGSSGLQITTSIILWLLAVLQIVFHFVGGGYNAPPLAQKGGVSFSTSNSDYFEA